MKKNKNLWKFLEGLEKKERTPPPELMQSQERELKSIVAKEMNDAVREGGDPYIIQKDFELNNPTLKIIRFNHFIDGSFSHFTII